MASAEDTFLGASLFAVLILVLGVAYSWIFYGTTVRHQSMMYEKQAFPKMLLSDILPFWLVGMVFACVFYEYEMEKCGEEAALVFSGVLDNARYVSVLMVFVLTFRASEAFSRWTNGRDHLGSLTSKSVQLLQSLRSMLKCENATNDASKELLLKEARLLKLYMLMQCNLLRNVSTFGKHSLAGDELQQAINSLTTEEFRILEKASQVHTGLGRHSMDTKLVRIMPAASEETAGVLPGLVSSRTNLCLILTWIEETVVDFANATGMPATNMNYMAGLVKQITDESENLWQSANTGIPIIMHWCLTISLFIYCSLVLPFVIVIEVAAEIDTKGKCEEHTQIAMAEIVMLLCYTIVMSILCSLKSMATQLSKPFGSYPMNLPMEKFCSQASENIDVVCNCFLPELSLRS
eukprot:TRINITY_DN33292_c0_g1_i1.p1 TRINITY_DN33292_c0_g1~~TRINITY_DN33292_c0_g1_i1.p1  ORF type:complete len:407 (-),score=57.68 TRINITY_DN33292_c0_g1_i1:44-1264(-)